MCAVIYKELGVARVAGREAVQGDDCAPNGRNDAAPFLQARDDLVSPQQISPLIRHPFQ
eukprot:COSAG03_NODE_20531_length_317_cov_1.665138_1_plen_58_part_10